MSHPINAAVVDGIAVDKEDFREYVEERTPLILADGNEIQGMELPNTTAVIVGAAAYGYDPLDTTSVHNGITVLVDATLPTGRRYIPGGIAPDSVTNAMLADMAAYSVKVNLTSGAANPTDVVRAGLTNVTAATTHRAIGWLSTGELRSFDLGNLAGLNTVGSTQIDNDAVTYAKIQNISVTQRVLGRNTGGAGDTEEVTATQVLDWIGATQGQVLFRGAASWTALAAGTAGFFLRAAGAAANPTWATPLATEISNAAAGNIAAATVQAAINELDTEKAGLALANVFTNTQTIQSTDAGATVGPILNIDRFSASPAAADILGSVEYHGRSSTAVDRIYASTKALITSPTNAAEAGVWNVATIQAGAVADRFRVGLGLYYAAGSDQGASTINALNLFVAGANISTLYQPLDGDLTSIAANATDGFLAHTAANTYVARSLAAPAAGFTITNPAGIAGNPTFVLANDLAALEGLAANGIITRTATDTMTVRTITGTASQITVTNGDGVSGNPTLSLPADVLIPTILTIPNSGLHVLDTNASHDLVITPGSDLTADRILTITTGDAARTLDISAGSVTISAAGAALIDDANVAAQITTLGLDNTKIATITFIIDGGGVAITTGTKGYLEIPFACTINRATALSDVSGSIVVDIWKDTYANYPPVDADSITASAPVTISSATKSQDATLTGWTTAVAAGDILGFNVDSITSCSRVTISLRVVKT